jgi:hypothetical protein
MAFGWISWYDYSDEEYAAELESRADNNNNN